MKYLLTYTGAPDAPPPGPETLAKLGAFVERMQASGVLILTGGLVRPSRGIQLVCEGGKASVVDGPYAETREVIDGFALVEVASQEEAVAQAREFMEIAGDGTGEILRVFDPGPPA
ncbi:MAG: YciI family protein [Myxococcota bacterium]